MLCPIGPLGLQRCYLRLVVRKLRSNETPGRAKTEVSAADMNCPQTAYELAQYRATLPRTFEEAAVRYPLPSHCPKCKREASRNNFHPTKKNNKNEGRYAD